MCTHTAADDCLRTSNTHTHMQKTPKALVRRYRRNASIKLALRSRREATNVREAVGRPTLFGVRAGCVRSPVLVREAFLVVEVVCEPDGESE